jgi:hypothetical protein
MGLEHDLALKTVQTTNKAYIDQESLNGLGKSRMFQMSNHRTDYHPWEFHKLFEAFGAMSCSIPQDRVFALLGMVAVRFEDSAWSKIIDYDLTVWQLLQKILNSEARIIRNPALVSFVNAYAANVILDKIDDNKQSLVSWNLDGFLDIPNDQPRVCLDVEQHSTPTQRQSQVFVYAQMFNQRAKVSYAYGHHLLSFLYTWSASSTQPYVMLCIAEWFHEKSSRTYRTYLVTYPCEDDCASHCARHSIAGFAIALGHGGYQVSADFQPIPTAWTKRNGSQQHAKVQSTTLPVALKSLKRSMRAVRIDVKDAGDAQYTLRTDLENLVQMSQTAKELERAFEAEFLDRSAPEQEHTALW